MFGQSPDEYMSERYRRQPSQALAAINTHIASGDLASALEILRQLAMARGGMQIVAERAKLNSTQIYRMLSRKGNPTLSGLTAILQALDLGISIHALPAATPDAATRQPEDPPIT